MTPEQFSQLVAVHGLPIPWLARHVGRVSERTMSYWVKGRPGQNVTVPEDVVKRLQRLNLAITRAID